MKKTLEDALAVHALIRKSEIEVDQKNLLPDRVRNLIENSGGPEKAERLSLDHITSLKEKIAELSVEIKKLSDEIETNFTRAPFVNRQAPK